MDPGRARKVRREPDSPAEGVRVEFTAFDFKEDVQEMAGWLGVMDNMQQTLAMSIGATNSERVVARCFTAWGAICLVYSFVLVKEARWRLNKHFRTLAAGDTVPNPWKPRVEALKNPVELCARLVARWV